MKLTLNRKCINCNYVVQTTVLSKRWKHLWLFAPCLDINQLEFLGPGNNFIDRALVCQLQLFTEATCADYTT
ncbi:hypothetical protein E2562_029205 [Oryza meyeriana var. granulata]|uniref:Uncharacterized protein n=1 Tax=Oryza meyeriana var. granulata TaxID=110450 RepID=A0A6G1E2M4_9ORYZ|nr:hypothetical protein E2562_029205 [Oryza meyeriana var. granulata]